MNKALSQYLVVAFIFFVFPISSSLQYFFSQYKTIITIDNNYLASIIVMEILQIGLFYIYMRVKNINVSDFNLNVNLIQIFHGIILFELIWIFQLYLFPSILNLLFQNVDEFGFINIVSTSIGPSLLISLLNPIAEEIMLIGFAFYKLGGNISIISIIGISTTIRCLYHTYQGVNGTIFSIFFGLICWLYFAKYRKLLPIIIAHGCHNFIYFYVYPALNQN